jgi:hypothetical protein
VAEKERQEETNRKTKAAPKTNRTEFNEPIVDDATSASSSSKGQELCGGGSSIRAGALVSRVRPG